MALLEAPTPGNFFARLQRLTFFFNPLDLNVASTPPPPQAVVYLSITRTGRTVSQREKYLSLSGQHFVQFYGDSNANVYESYTR